MIPLEDFDLVKLPRGQAFICIDVDQSVDFRRIGIRSRDITILGFLLYQYLQALTDTLA